MATSSTNARLDQLYMQLQFGKSKPQGAKHKGFPVGGAKKLRTVLTAIKQKHPEVMVKISNTSKGGKGASSAKTSQGMKSIRAHLSYITRGGKLELTDQDGNTIKGKDELKSFASDLQSSGAFIPEVSNKKEAFNIVFSMPAGTPEGPLVDSVSSVSKKLFANHDYAFAVHTHDNDPGPSPSKNPHVHVLVKARGHNGRRLNPRKGDLRQWRELFAEDLRERGIDAVASTRAQRLSRSRGLNQEIKHMLARGETPATQGKKSQPEIVKKAIKTRSAVESTYREIIDVLNQSDKHDRALARGLSYEFFEKGFEKERGGQGSSIER